ncbi:DNA helicase [Tanacetum coccineum]
MNTSDALFGGKTIVLGGDFCQNLSVKKGASKFELIASSIVESDLWWHFKEFAAWILEVGNGELGEPDEEEAEATT